MAGGDPARSASQQRAIDAKTRSHCALSEAQSHLYAVLSAALVGRERAWAQGVVGALRAAHDAVEQHAAEVGAPDGLYGEILLDAPWLERRVERVQRQLARLRQQVGDLARTVESVAGGERDAARSVRYEAEQMLVALRDLMSQENELVYERLDDPPALD